MGRLVSRPRGEKSSLSLRLRRFQLKEYKSAGRKRRGRGGEAISALAVGVSAVHSPMYREEADLKFFRCPLPTAFSESLALSPSLPLWPFLRRRRASESIAFQRPSSFSFPHWFDGNTAPIAFRSPPSPLPFQAQGIKCPSRDPLSTDCFPPFVSPF